MEENNHRFYVYVYEDANKVFYVGKGTGNRASAPAIGERDITIIARDLTEEQALDIEAFLINRLSDLENKAMPTTLRRPEPVPIPPHLKALISRKQAEELLGTLLFREAGD